jgi:hypothetical protein
MVRASPPGKDTDRLMASLPHASDTPSTCTAPHLDGCPECVVNVEAASMVVRKDGSCIATYLCTDCGHQWTTSWGCS